MKILAIGDIHGLDVWKQIVAKEDFDRVVFIGDYFDSFTVKGDLQLENFKDIIEFKNQNPDKCTLLIGNHDHHYMPFTNQRYSGYQKGYQYQIQDLLNKAIGEGLMQMCYTNGKFLFVHAGVTKTWCDNNEIDLSNIEQSINDRFTYKPRSFNFTAGENMSPYGDDICQTPIWVRPQSLMKDMVDGYTQIVGHTQKDKIYQFKDLILIDALPVGEYLKIIDEEIHICKI